MTSKKRILNMLKGKPVDRIPWAPTMVWSYLETLEGWPLEEMQQIRFLRELYAELDADMIIQNKPQRVGGYCQTTWDKGVKKSGSCENNVTHLTIETPLGALHCKREIEDGFSYVMGPFIKRPEDCRIYSYYLEAKILIRALFIELSLVVVV